MPHLPIIAAAVLLLSVLLVVESRGLLGAKIGVKSALSCLFVVAAMVQPHGWSGYFVALLAGLVLCLAGDVCLAVPGRRTFLAGLVAFLLGHVAYIVAFSLVAGPSVWVLPGLVVLSVASGGVFAWLRPGLGSMKLPVLAYVVVITVMVTAAWSVFLTGEHGIGARLLVFAGALLFYLSDLTVARERFVRKGFLNKILGWPPYYAGQFLFAFSAGLLG